MKAIIFGHEKNGIYVMDRNGVFHFVPEMSTQPIGTEVDIKTRKFFQLHKIATIALCLIIAMALTITLLTNFTTDSVMYEDVAPAEVPLEDAPSAEKQLCSLYCDDECIFGGECRCINCRDDEN